MPNFVFIMTDTQGADVVGCYRDSELGARLGTPNLDRLAAQGVRFERAYTTCPLCTPARAGIFTGLMPSVAGPVTNNLACGANIRNMAHHFRAAGYRTAYTGKWHLDGLDYFDSGICPPEWEDAYWYDGRRHLASLTDEEIRLWRQGLRTPAELRAHGIGPEFTWAHRCSDRAIEFLRNAGDRPFVLCVSYDEPHGPCTCPPEYVERFADFAFPIGPGAHDDLRGKPALQREWAASLRRKPSTGFWRASRYFGCNSFVDAEIGRVLDAVNRHAPPDTYVIYTSDHGALHEAHGLAAKGPAMYDEAARIPLIVRGPVVRPGHLVRRPASHLDILPTMLALAGRPVPPLLQGIGLTEALAGGEAPDRPIPIEFTRFSINHDGWGGYQPIRAVVRNRFKLVVNLHDTDELYDLEADPHELANRIEDPALAAVRDALHDDLLAEMDRVRDPFRGPCWERRPWRRERRRGWSGGYRHRADDGFSPRALDYHTGRPPEN